jgi:hypothetical protein
MSVFLRWGIFGILGVAALLYAYNASKRMAERQARNPAPVAQAVAAPVNEVNAAPEEPAGLAAGDVASGAATAAPEPAAPLVSETCEAELRVAQRALEARKNGDPLDRLLRIQEIAFQEPARRARLEKVATRYFDYEGDFRPDALRIAVISDCAQSGQ